MTIEITQVTQWSRVLDSARWTMGKDGLNKEPSVKFKDGILLAQHSPIRLLEFDIKIKDIPYRYAVHFVRHHQGIEKFQCTLRDDRNKEITDSEELPQGQPVNLWIACNAEALINISRKRLCSTAHPRTRSIWQAVRKEMWNTDARVAKVMVKECVYRGFCPQLEDDCCGYADTPYFEVDLKAYRRR